MEKRNRKTAFGLFARLTGRSLARSTVRAMVMFVLFSLTGLYQNELAAQGQREQELEERRKQIKQLAEQLELQLQQRNQQLQGLPVAPMPQGNAPQIQRVQQMRIVGGNQLFAGSPDSESNHSGATLKTDPELEAILEKADRFKTEKQYGIAAKLWQTVLDRSGDTLFSSDNQIYYSLSRKVEQILAGLPQDGGLSDYRITADANAKEIMAEANGDFDEQALQKIVRSYFLSSLGDDAAMTLSSIYMDKHDFVGASRMLQKIVSTYPDPSVSLVDVQTRIGLCQSMMGEVAFAEAAIARAREQSAADQQSGAMDAKSLQQLVAVEKAIAQNNGEHSSRRVNAGFEMALANRNRTGVMPSLPANYLSTDLETVWQYHFKPKVSRWADIRRVKPILGDEVLAETAKTVSERERSMISRWRDNSWRPAGDLLFDKDNVYFKTSIDLSVWDRSADSDQVVWRPQSQNAYRLDEQTKNMIEVRRRMHRSRRQPASNDSLPRESHEFQLFADRISAQMSIQNNVLYSIEGIGIDRVGTPTRQDILAQMRYNVHARRSRSNRLSAYDVATGKMLWSLPPLEVEFANDDPFGDDDAEDVRNLESNQAADAGGRNDFIDDEEESPWLKSGGFMAAPVAYAGMLIVPVNHGGTISIYALDPEQEGKTIWKAYLCDESETGANPYAPINLAIDGSDLFASCGLGVVFILDPTTGLIRFAKRYEREGTPLVSTGRFGRTYQKMNFNAWTSDTVLAFGRQMVCFSSDAKRIEAHNRNTGDLIWYGTFDPLETEVDYLLGVYDGILYAAGPQTILAFDLKREGRMLWGGEVMFDGKISHGRGMLTSEGIYIPVANRILKYSLLGKKAERVAEVEVDLGTGAPLGNLYSDGEKIWVLGANRVYALGKQKTRPRDAGKKRDTE